jgi:hypothetical protein
MHIRPRDLLAAALGAALALAVVELVPTVHAQSAGAGGDLQARQVRALEQLVDASKDQARELGRLVSATERAGR